MKERKADVESKGIGFFERYLTVWVILCIVAGIALGKLAPGVARSLDAMAIYVGEAPVVSIPIALCLFFMMYPIMVKIDFAEVLRAGKAIKPVGLTLFINWAIKPFTMYAIALFFLGTLFLGFIGPDAVDYVKMPLGVQLDVGDTYGSGQVVMHEGQRMLEVPLWRSYLAGCILLGIAPCTAMVLVWGYLARGNDGHTLVMVAINSLTMLVLYGVLGGFLLGVGKLPVPWQALLLSIGIYVALPLLAGYFTRKWIIAAKGEAWFKDKFPALPYAGHDHRAAGNLDSAVLVQGRRDSLQSTHDSLDRHPAVHPDSADLRPRVRAVEAAASDLRKCSSQRHDRSVEPF